TRSSILERRRLWPDRNLPVLHLEAPALSHTVRPIPLSRRAPQVRSRSARLPSPCSIVPCNLLTRPATLSAHTFSALRSPSRASAACLLYRLQRKQSGTWRYVCSSSRTTARALASGQFWLHRNDSHAKARAPDTSMQGHNWD